MHFYSMQSWFNHDNSMRWVCYYYYAHFPNEKTEAQRGWVSWLRSFGQSETDTGSDTGSLALWHSLLTTSLYHQHTEPPEIPELSLGSLRQEPIELLLSKSCGVPLNWEDKQDQANLLSDWSSQSEKRFFTSPPNQMRSTKVRSCALTSKIREPGARLFSEARKCLIHLWFPYLSSAKVFCLKRCKSI